MGYHLRRLFLDRYHLLHRLYPILLAYSRAEASSIASKFTLYIFNFE